MTYEALIRYLAATRTPLPPVRAALEYVLAANGIFVRGRRRGLSVTMPLVAALVKGLHPLTPAFALHYPLVPAGIVETLLRQARWALDPGGRPVEMVFHLAWAGSAWRLDTPPQAQSSSHAQPLGPALDSSYADALIEVHSHHQMPAFFSEVDNADESGFRLYAVVGDIFHQAQIRVRVGLYGHYWPVPARWVFVLPPYLTDIAP